MEALILEPSLYTVKAVIILDNDGDRLFAKYYDDTYPSAKEQKAFEKNIFNKTHRTDSEIALLEGLTVVYKSSIDLYFYVIGSSHGERADAHGRPQLPLRLAQPDAAEERGEAGAAGEYGGALPGRGRDRGWWVSVFPPPPPSVVLESDPSKWCIAWPCGARTCPSLSRRCHRCCSRQRSRSSGRCCV
ncbi:unnamed protein product, partial [Bubo scandiacus]